MPTKLTDDAQDFMIPGIVDPAALFSCEVAYITLFEIERRAALRVSELYENGCTE